MPRTGRDLEQLVAHLETFLGPRGAEIRSPDHLPDRVTGERREVDVSIRLRVGSAPVLLIVECRDRSRVEDVTWIEQLASKRDDVGAAKAIAVSSTGFSSAAERKARFMGIETRRIIDIDESDVQMWFQVDAMTVHVSRCELHGVSMDVDATDWPDFSIDEKYGDRLRRVGPTDSAFVRKADGKLCSLTDIWKSITANAGVYKAVPDDGTRVRRTLDLRFRDPKQRFQLATPKGSIDVARFVFDVTLWIDASQVPIRSVSRYDSHDNSVAHAVTFEVDVDERRLQLSFQREPATGKKGLTLSVVDRQTD